jgi:serine/threonine-protein kinase
MSLLKEAQVIGSTYEVERLLGEGAFAEVYRVKHRFLGRQAMKVFKLVGMTVEEVERSLSEACLLSRLGHPNIIRVFEANIADTAAGQIGYFTMEYLPGGTLSEFRRSFGKPSMPVQTVVEINRQVCCALNVAHASKPPIIHRDVKPQNILIGYDAEGPQARLSDFGLARHVNPLILQASVRGTRSFKPPESFLNGDADSCSGDVWALGLCFYLLLTDTFPYLREEDSENAVPAIPTRPWLPPSALNVQVDDRIDAVVHKALALQPEERYRDAGEFLHSLVGIAEKVCTQRNTADSSSDAGSVAPATAEARQMAQEATRLAKDSSRLRAAAMLLERAIKASPQLRDEYGYRLDLWKRGIAQ